MAKPTTVPTWATDTNYSSGPASGTPTKVSASGIQAQGWKPGDEPGAQNFNWWKNLVGQWLTFLDPLFGDNGLVVPSQTKTHNLHCGMSTNNANISDIGAGWGMLATANAAVGYMPCLIVFRPGDRITGIQATLVGDGSTQNVTVDLMRVSSLGAGAAAIATVTAVNPPTYATTGGPVKYTRSGVVDSLPYTVVADDCFFWKVTMPQRTGVSTATYQVGVTFDRLNG